jgi:drug/metabolite transporter (DMT)-like permease
MSHRPWGQKDSMTSDSNHRAATRLGVAAISLWAILASLTALAGPIPPFQLTAMTFALGTLTGLIYARVTGQSLAALKSIPPAALALGVYGLLGFHGCYFFALQNAPALEASLIVYLWPLLIVMLSGGLPARHGGENLRWWHVAGAVLGFAGSAVILLSRGSVATPTGSKLGYALAFAAALIWSTYSVGLRMFAKVPSVGVIASCAATALGATLLHLATERWVQPTSLTAWLAIAGLGLGPAGLAFYLWDDGMKRGNMRLLGVLSYVTPLASTLIMASLRLGQLDASIWLAALLITAGALLAGSGAMLSRTTQKRPG